jgi:hypothetical protein
VRHITPIRITVCGCGGDDLVRDGRPLAGELRSQDRVVQQRQDLGQRGRIPEGTSVIDCFEDAVERAGAHVQLLGRQTRSDAHGEVRSRVLHAIERGSQRGVERVYCVGLAVLEHPDATEADGCFGMDLGIDLGIRSVECLTEGRARPRQPSAGKFHLCLFEQQTGRRGSFRPGLQALRRCEQLRC